jgi:hypothetical protein
MAAVEFPVEVLGAAVSDRPWFWASRRSRFPGGLPSASRLESTCLRTAPWQQWPVILRIGSPSPPICGWRLFSDFARIAISAAGKQDLEEQFSR